jgi:hypothetical protein
VIVLVGVLALLILAAFASHLVDRADRRRGRPRRDSGSMWRELREANRDGRALSDSNLAIGGVAWTAASRRNAKP